MPNYVLTAAGPDHRFGTRDDIKIALRSAKLDASSEVVKITTRRPLPFRHRYHLFVKGGNSGVALRSPMKGDPAYTGMEIQILDDVWHKANYKGLKPTQLTGAIYDVVPPSKPRVAPLATAKEPPSLPPPCSDNRPPLTLTVPVLLKGTERLVVPEPLLTNVPALLTALLLPL